MGKDKKANFISDFLAGGVAACIAKTMVAPIERVKALLQTEAANRQLAKSGEHYKGIGDCFSKIIKK